MVDIPDPGEVQYNCPLLSSNVPAHFSHHMVLGREVEAGGEGDGGEAVGVGGGGGRWGGEDKGECSGALGGATGREVIGVGARGGASGRGRGWA